VSWLGAATARPLGGTEGSRASICQRAVGEYPLPDYAPVGSVYRLSELVLSLSKETRMLGGIRPEGRGPGYPIGH